MSSADCPSTVQNPSEYSFACPSVSCAIATWLCRSLHLFSLQTPMTRWQLRCAILRPPARFRLTCGTLIRRMHCIAGTVRVNVCATPRWAKTGLRMVSSTRWFQCDDCGGQFTHPSPSPEVLKQLYSEGFAYKWYRHHYPARSGPATSGPEYARMGALKKGPLLDYGGGAGYFWLAARLCG